MTVGNIKRNINKQKTYFTYTVWKLYKDFHYNISLRSLKIISSFKVSL